jgi:hypothetical protein
MRLWAGIAYFHVGLETALFGQLWCSRSCATLAAHNNLASLTKEDYNVSTRGRHDRTRKVDVSECSVIDIFQIPQLRG